MQSFVISFFFFFNDPATTEIYTLSLHDALPISRPGGDVPRPPRRRQDLPHPGARDRKSTRLNSSHLVTSYAVFCLKKKIKSDLFRQRQQAIETLLAAAGRTEYVALVKQRRVGDDPAFVELAFLFLAPHATAISKPFV